MRTRQLIVSLASSLLVTIQHCLPQHESSLDKFLQSMRISQDEKRFLFEDGHGTVKVFSMETWKQLLNIEDATLPHVSPDGKFLVAASSHKSLKVWNLETGTMLYDLKVETDGIIGSVGFSPTGKFIYANCHPNSLVESLEQMMPGLTSGYSTTWEASTGKFIQAHKKLLYKFSPDDSSILFVSRAAPSYVYDDVCAADSDKIIFSFVSYGALPQWSENGKYLLNYTLKNTELWQIPTGRKVFTLDKTPCGFSKDGKYIGCRSDPKELPDEFWETESHASVSMTPCRFYTQSIPNKDHFVVTPKYNKLEIWNTDSCKRFYSDNESFVEYSPDGRYILTRPTQFRNINLRNLATGELVQSFNSGKEIFNQVLFSPTGKYVITLASGVSENLSIWEVSSGKLVYHVRGFAIRFTKDEKLCFIASKFKIQVYNLHSGETLATIE